MEIRLNGRTYKKGQKVKATINRGEQFVAMLYNNGRFWYLLHNNSVHNGSRPDNMHEYNYSWQFNTYDDGTLTDGVNIQSGIENCKESFLIQNQFDKFLRSRINTEYLEKKDVVKNASQIFSIYTQSNDSKYGFVKFINEKGSITEMKFGRFLICYINDVKKNHNVDLSIDDKTIEKFHNEYITHQKESDIKIKFLKGEDILEAYTRDNYHENCGRIGGSCMTDKTSFLKLYTQSDSVELLAIEMNNKYIGRALVWTTNNGKYLDSIYTTQDWVYSIFDYVRAEHGLKVASEEQDIKISVNTENIEKFPYLDTFIYLTPDGKTLYNKNIDHKDGTKILRSTTGGYDTIYKTSYDNDNNDPF